MARNQEISREEWLELRKRGIGGSEAASILGLNPYMDIMQLWEIKTGRRERENIDDKECIVRGTLSEEHIRALWEIEHPEFSLEYKGENDIVFSDDYDFLFATTDGYITENDTGKSGILEIKTTKAFRKSHLDLWDGRVPDNYYCQCLHYLNVIKADFIILVARIQTSWNNSLVMEKSYRLDAADCIKEIVDLEKKEVEFWNKNVLEDVMPSRTLII